MPVDYALEAKLSYLSWLAAEDRAAEEFVRTLRDYAAGEHPTYLTDRQKEFLGLKAKKADHLYAHNLCQLVIDAVVERLEVTGFNTVDETLTSPLIDAAAQWWEANRMDAGQDRIYETACRDGESYLIVDWDDVNKTPRWTLNERFDGTQGVRLYRDPNTNTVLFAAKRWQIYDPYDKALNGRTRMTLYFPDRVEKYISTQTNDLRPMKGYLGEIIQFTRWQQWRDSANEPWPIPWQASDGEPLGCAVIAFENPGGSEINQLLPIQDMLNKSDLDLIAASDTSGFRILFAAGVDALIGSDGQEVALQVGPGQLIRMSDPQAKLGAIEPVDLERVISASKYWIESAAGITRTPQYLFQTQGADQPSGESLKMQEVGLTHKAERRQRVWGNCWEDVIYLSAKLHNLFASPQLAPVKIQAQWVDPQLPTDPIAEEAAKAEARKANVEAGLPLRLVLQREGWSDEELKEFDAQVAAEAERQRATLAESMLRAQRQFDAGQMEGD